MSSALWQSCCEHHVLSREYRGCFAPYKLSLWLFCFLSWIPMWRFPGHDSLLHKNRESWDWRLQSWSDFTYLWLHRCCWGCIQACMYAHTAVVIHFRRDIHHLLESWGKPGGELMLLNLCYGKLIKRWAPSSSGIEERTWDRNPDKTFLFPGSQRRKSVLGAEDEDNLCFGAGWPADLEGWRFIPSRDAVGVNSSGAFQHLFFCNSPNLSRQVVSCCQCRTSLSFSCARCSAHFVSTDMVEQGPACPSK